MRDFFIIIGVLLVIILGFALSFASFFEEPPSKTLSARLGGQLLVLEVADTDARRVQGLSGRKSLPHNHGMLFVFPVDGMYGFWMKDMHFPVDIIWLDGSYRIVDVNERVSPSSYPIVFYPDVSTRYTLEVSSGFFEKNKLAKGMTLEILK